MQQLILLFIVASLALGGVAYFVSVNLYLAIGVALLFILVFCLIVNPAINKFQKVQQKRHECYTFVNSFLITMSVCSSLQKSFELATQTAQKDFKATLDAIALYETKERVEYLSNYFETPIYDMFLSVLDIYMEQGGDILKLSKTLMEELTRIEESALSLSKHAISILIQWIVLWAMSLAILVFVRFGLDSFYTYLSSSPSYLAMIVLYFALLLVSIMIFTQKYTGIKLFAGKKKQELKGAKDGKN